MLQEEASPLFNSKSQHRAGQRAQTYLCSVRRWEPTRKTWVQVLGLFRVCSESEGTQARQTLCGSWLFSFVSEAWPPWDFVLCFPGFTHRSVGLFPPTRLQ